MSQKVSIEKMADAIAKELKEYSQEAQEVLNKSVKDVTKQCVKDTKEGAPKRTGAYKKSWTSKVQYEKSDDIRTVVYAKAPYYRLTHLLENGHAKVGGGRVEGHPHIAPAEAKAEASLENKVKVGIQRL